MVADSRTAPGGPGGLARPGGRRGPGGVLTVPLGQLGLSEEQRDAVRGVLEEGREALREAGEQARASRQALRDAVGTGGDVDEDAIRAAAAGLGTAQGAMALARASARARIWEVLTPDQRTAADVLRAAREQRMEARRERFEERRERWEERRMGGAPRPAPRAPRPGGGTPGTRAGLAARNRRLRPSGFERRSPFGGCAVVVCPEALGRRRGHWPEAGQVRLHLRPRLPRLLDRALVLDGGDVAGVAVEDDRPQRDDGRDALSMPSPPPAGRRGSRDRPRGHGLGRRTGEAVLERNREGRTA